MLDKFTSRQRITGVVSKENPFAKFDLKTLINLAIAADGKKMDAVFKQTELLIEDYFESRKNYYKNLKKVPQFRTDEVRQQERLNDKKGSLGIKAK